MPTEELPEGCFEQVLGRPIDPQIVWSVQAKGPERWLLFLQERKLNEQSRYKLMRSFFPMNFKEFKKLESRVNRVYRGSSNIA